MAMATMARGIMARTIMLARGTCRFLVVAITTAVGTNVGADTDTPAALVGTHVAGSTNRLFPHRV